MFVKFPRACMAPDEGGAPPPGGAPAPAAVPAPQLLNPAPAAPPSAAPVPAATSWDAALDPAQRKLVETKGWGSPADVLRDYEQIEGMIGRDKIALPGKDAKPEDFAKVYDALGRPASADKYDLGGFKPPEGLPWDANQQTAILGKMHELGLNSAQAAGLVQAYAEMQGQAWSGFQEGAVKFAEKSAQDLRKEWGAAFDQNMEIANRTVRAAFGDDLAAATEARLQDGTFLLDNPMLARAFAKLGAEMSEDSDLMGTKGQPVGGAIRTPAQAKVEIERIRGEAASDPQHPYVNRKHPEYKAMQQKMNELYALQSGSASG